MWPSETLVRLFKGDYIPGLHRDYAGKRVIDIGFGNGNNLMFLASLGLYLYGTEVREEICEMVRQKLARLGLNADLRVGTNRCLPFADNEFDFLVSWNVIHYEDNEAAICEAIAEYHRVLAPGGRFFVSTTGPEHKILRDSDTLGGHRYRIGRDDDFRKGQVFFYFDAPNYVQCYFSRLFSKVLVGRTHDFLMTETLDWFVATGVKE
ncbi:MAG: class I SAM-dependent methyltransferase [Nitrospira sp.]|nr:class I SAM-dependent methyltransferase [Nitrospira sp.]